MENTYQNHRKFRALYICQPVLISKNLNGLVVNEISLQKDKLEDGSYLHLAPISLITQESAIELIKIKLFSTGHKPENIGVISVDIHNKPIEINKVYIEATVQYKETEFFGTRLFLGNDSMYGNYLDFLRANGYAVDWNGLTVQEMIDFGWVKLKL